MKESPEVGGLGDHLGRIMPYTIGLELGLPLFSGTFL